MKNRKLITKILLFVGLPVALIIIIMMYILTKSVQQSVSQLTTEELTAKSQSSSYQINNYFSKYIETVKQIATNETLQDFLENTSSKPNINEVTNFQDISQTVKNITDSDKNIVYAWVSDTATNHCIDPVNGVSEFTISSRPWYKKLAERKNVIITDPYEDVDTKALTVSIIAPIYKNSSNEMTGVVGIDITLDNLYKTISQYKLGKDGFYMLTSENGQLIYHPELSLKNKNITESKMSENIIQAMQTKKEGFLSYAAQNTTNYGYVAKIGDTGWTVATGLPEKEYKHTFYTILNKGVIIFIIAMLILFILIFITSRSIVNPLIQLKKAANQIADGDLDVSIQVRSQDEIGQVSTAFNKTVERLKQYIAYINEISSVLNQIADGNLVFNLQCDYVGEFSKIRDSLENIKATLVQTFTEINRSADEVASGSSQVSSGAQSLAQGASEQASSIEELSASITQIEEDVKQNAENATSADDLSKKASGEVERENELMQKLMKAMTDISTSSNQISNINKAIEDIAFQTNILALNAAVEAARAGSAGKGFSVVADEVRNLAGKSAKAAKDTAELIENAMKSVQNGSNIATETEQSLNDLILDANKTTDFIAKITKACTEQAAAITQIKQGMDQISSVVQTNSATAEESAASSEELNGQAESLKLLIQKFKTE